MTRIQERPRRAPPLPLPDPRHLGLEISAWGLALVADGKSASTVRTYTDAATRLAGWLLVPVWPLTLAAGEGRRRTAAIPATATDPQTGIPDWAHPVAAWSGVRTVHLRGFIAWLLSHYSKTFANNQYRAIQQFWSWYARENQLTNPMVGMKPPKPDTRPPPVLTVTELATLIGDAEAGTSFVARRDAAILRFLASTGCRLEEVAELQITHLDVEHLTALVKGKGGKARLVRFDRRCAAALKRYLPMRAGHRHAASGHMWLGACNRPPLQANGVYQMVVRRSARLGIHAYPHKFRHTFAHNWLDNGGHEGDLMVLSGWTSEAMVHYYGSSVSGERARRHYDQIDVMRGV